MEDKRYGKGYYADKLFQDRNKKKEIAENPDRMVSLWVCHNCKITYFHQIVYCAKCPGELVQVKCLNKELAELLPGYLHNYF